MDCRHLCDEFDVNCRLIDKVTIPIKNSFLNEISCVEGQEKFSKILQKYGVSPQKTDDVVSIGGPQCALRLIQSELINLKTEMDNLKRLSLKNSNVNSKLRNSNEDEVKNDEVWKNVSSSQKIKTDRCENSSKTKRDNGDIVTALKQTNIKDHEDDDDDDDDGGGTGKKKELCGEEFHDTFDSFEGVEIKRTYTFEKTDDQIDENNLKSTKTSYHSKSEQENSAEKMVSSSTDSGLVVEAIAEGENFQMHVQNIRTDKFKLNKKDKKNNLLCKIIKESYDFIVKTDYIDQSNEIEISYDEELVRTNEFRNKRGKIETVKNTLNNLTKNKTSNKTELKDEIYDHVSKEIAGLKLFKETITIKSEIKDFVSFKDYIISFNKHTDIICEYNNSDKKDKTLSVYGIKKNKVDETKKWICETMKEQVEANKSNLLKIKNPKGTSKKK